AMLAASTKVPRFPRTTTSSVRPRPSFECRTAAFARAVFSSESPATRREPDDEWSRCRRGRPAAAPGSVRLQLGADHSLAHQRRLEVITVPREDQPPLAACAREDQALPVDPICGRLLGSKHRDENRVVPVEGELIEQAIVPAILSTDGGTAPGQDKGEGTGDGQAQQFGHANGLVIGCCGWDSCSRRDKSGA